MVQGRLPHLVHNYIDAASSREDPSRAASHAEPSAVVTARAVATASGDGESSGVDELLANFSLAKMELF